MSDRNRAIAYWQAIQTSYPHPRVAQWLEYLQSNESVDWWRNGGLALIAIAKHSYTGRYFNQHLYDNGKIHINNLLNKFNLSLQA